MNTFIVIFGDKAYEMSKENFREYLADVVESKVKLLEEYNAKEIRSDYLKEVCMVNSQIERTKALFVLSELEDDE
jgi:benzoyl-CoA reductase/2-hydroxyglutaryl-CoA dehydratase subunit BcrC/BadD/HgdB